MTPCHAHGFASLTSVCLWHAVRMADLVNVACDSTLLFNALPQLSANSALQFYHQMLLRGCEPLVASRW